MRWLVVCALAAASRIAAAQPAPSPPPGPAPTTTTPAAPTDTPSPPVDATQPDAPVSPAPPPPEGQPRAPALTTKPPTTEALRDRAAAEALCAARDPSCDWLSTFSSLERATVARALARRGYVIDPSPWGKPIGAVRVYNEEVFAEGAAFLRFFNHFHVTSKEAAVRAEAVIHAGEIWDQDRVEETARKLRDPLWSSVVAVVPVLTTDPAKVDLLIVTRDIWSLRFNTQYTFQEGSLTNLLVSLSENNFLGRRDVLSLAVTMDQATIATGPVFIDKSVLGKHIDFRVRYDRIINREALLDHGQLANEGSQSTITLSRPLWSLATEWSAGATFTHHFATDRQFLGTGLRPYDNPDTATMERVDRAYHMRRWSMSEFVTRQFGSSVKQQLSLGHTISSVHPTLLDSFPDDPVLRAAFVRDVLPRSEVTSAPYLEYSLFTPRYRTLRNVQTFALAEDAKLGPDLDVVYGVGLKALGSDENFQRGSVSTGYTLPWARDGFARASVGMAWRHQEGEFIDNTASASLRVATPVFEYGRIVAQATIATRWHDTQNGYYAIGSDTGLRGFRINEFFGQRVFGTQVEARSLPYAIWVLRVGGVAFYDIGGAADTFRQMQVHQDAGFGLRTLIPQTSREVLRFDLAFPFDGPSAGHPRFSAGFDQSF